MTDMPSGIVTFLFTDIEGFTRRFEAGQDATPAIIRRHNDLLRAAIEGHGGVVVNPTGDGFLAAFHDVRDALLAAIEGQQALAAELWDGEPVKVRMALHTGRAVPVQGDYQSLSANRAARLLPGAWGGQIVLSSATHPLLLDDLPPQVDLVPLGEYLLKDLGRNEHVYQVVAPGLPLETRPFRLPHARPLPTSVTPFIGRQTELAEALDLLEREDVRLLTLVGPGGTGKTRLALQLAAEVIDQYPQGIVTVKLAPLTDLALVVSTLADQLGLKKVDGQPLEETVAAHLAQGRRLLVLDNAEHLWEAVAGLAIFLLERCPDLKLLVTSRHALGLELDGEQLYHVPPLQLPPRPPPSPTPESLTPYDAVKLFISVAKRLRPDFAVNDANAPAVAELCHRVDGLPLAVELVAARTKYSSPQEILQQFSLDLLGRGTSQRERRRQTMRGAIQWSYDLLSQSERAVFAALSVFAGGCRREAIEAVAGSGAMASAFALVDHSLLRLDEDPDRHPRYHMLETIRVFAGEQLDASGKTDAIRARHAAYVARVLRQALPKLDAPDGAAWLNRLKWESDNLRVAMETAVATQGPAGQLIGKWTMFTWCGESDLLGFKNSSLLLLEDALADSPWIPGTDRHAACHHLGMLASDFGDYVEARRFYGESLAIERELGDRGGEAATLHELGNIAADQGDYAEARRLYGESLTIKRGLGDRPGGSATLVMLAQRLASSNPKQAVALAAAAVSMRRAMGLPEIGEWWERKLADWQSELGKARFTAAWVRGEQLDLDSATYLALQALKQDAQLT